MINSGKKTYLLLSMGVAVGLLFHGASFFNTLEKTYDAYVHMFFASHYAEAWFDTWEPRWYTGFHMVSYPPMVHQLIALLSFIGGLKLGTYLLAFGIVILYVTGMYRFAKLITVNEEAAGYTALIGVFTPSIIESLHVFGQLPSVMGIGWLLHALPEIYLFIRYGKTRYYLNAISLIAVAVCSHHVTPIFGMVFFVLPLMGTVILDAAKEESGKYSLTNLKLLWKYVRRYLPRIIFFGLSTIIVAIVVILPYWLWSKNDPITQIPIPHGSRDNFLEVFSSGLVFFLLPWGFLLFILPFAFYRFFSRRNLFFGFSFSLLFILGTGGTTPIPKMLLGENAFSILTLERFTFWATIMATPLAGELLWRLVEGDLYQKIKQKGRNSFKLLVAVIAALVFLSAGFTMNLSYFRPLQPDKIDIEPITNFLDSDKHYKWRYLTLGFGDQVAWLSANTNARTIDGNYHSARRVPELTTRAIERLENAKYRGLEGIATLQQFLSVPEKYHLKYIFSNDKFYDPLLYFYGWHRVKRLENGIMIWEREGVSPLPSLEKNPSLPLYQRIMWGTIPVTVLLIAFFFNIQLHWIHHIGRRRNRLKRDSYHNPETAKALGRNHNLILGVWMILVVFALSYLGFRLLDQGREQDSPEKVVTSYYDALDFKKFRSAWQYYSESTAPDFDQFMLENSVKDGIVESYGKINSIRCEVEYVDKNNAFVIASIEWVTPMEEYRKTIRHKVVRNNSEWFIQYRDFEYSLPTKQFVTRSNVQFYNQGRRHLTTEETFHTDVIDKPKLDVVKTSLVLQNDEYILLGIVRNIDHYPADITLSGTLYDIEGRELTRYNEDFSMIHKLFPGQESPFRIRFEDPDWLSRRSARESLSHEVKLYSLEISTNATVYDLSGDLVILDFAQDSASIRGRVYNQGLSEVTIPQLLTAETDSLGRLVSVDSYLIENSIAPDRDLAFTFPKTDPTGPGIISTNPLSVTVNGKNDQQEIRNENFDGKEIKLYINSFIGNLQQ